VAIFKLSQAETRHTIARAQSSSRGATTPATATATTSARAPSTSPPQGHGNDWTEF
jgi:hypothetical protein